MTQAFRLDQDGHVATLTLSNPERRNALAPALWEDLPDAIEALDRSGTCRALVIQSEGPHFCSGIDLSLLGSTRPDNLGAAQGLDVYAVIKRMQRTFTALEEARFPVIAAIQGGCIGAGVDLATACDLRMCTDDAYFTVYEIVMGMTADVGTFPRILNLLPEGIVRELSYTGRKFKPDEALRLGFVNRVLPDHEAANSAAQEMAQEIAAKAPMAIHGIKEIIKFSRDHSTEDALDRIALWNASNLQPSELMAAMGAKQTGEPGQFTALPQRRKVDNRD